MRDALGKAARKGMVLIAAAGNAGPKSGPQFPAAHPNVIPVTATDPDDAV
jgi:subtilisin family serine protease